FFFFVHAEDGIRDFHVTGVQTCALPIWKRDDQATCVLDDADLQIFEARGKRGCEPFLQRRNSWLLDGRRHRLSEVVDGFDGLWRSEERRVGKESSLPW